jgi:hypothetical protein
VGCAPAAGASGAEILDPAVEQVFDCVSSVTRREPKINSSGALESPDVTGAAGWGAATSVGRAWTGTVSEVAVRPSWLVGTSCTVPGRVLARTSL